MGAAKAVMEVFLGVKQSPGFSPTAKGISGQLRTTIVLGLHDKSPKDDHD